MGGGLLTRVACAGVRSFVFVTIGDVAAGSCPLRHSANDEGRGRMGWRLLTGIGFAGACSLVFVGVGGIAAGSCHCGISWQGGDGRVALTWVV